METIPNSNNTLLGYTMSSLTNKRFGQVNYAAYKYKLKLIESLALKLVTTR